MAGGGRSIMSPRAASAAPNWEYGVFVSFRGEDTRKGFMSHLFSALESADIRCYRDNDHDQRGRVVGPMLLDAIHGSRISLILFSTRYADSNWCLDELVEIMKCASMYRDHGHMVVPIFYDVEPSDVRRQTGKFGEGFESCLAEEGHAKEAAWRSALEHAGKRSGWHLKNDANGNEAELIKEIVGQIISQVAFTNSPYFISDAVGIDSNVDDVISLMNNGSEDDVRVIGVFGMKGIGKTTLAKLVCSRVFSKFKGVSFLADIGDAKHQGLIGFQKTLINDIVKVKHVTLTEHDSNRNVSIIRDRLSQKKILLVLDDVRERKQVLLLCGRKGFLGPGSKVLITTEHEKLLDDIQVDSKYMVSGLSSKDSLQLLSRYAFYDDVPEKGYEKLSEKVVHYAGGLPSALVTLGSCFSGKAEDQWVMFLEKIVQDPNLGWIEAYSENVDSILCRYQFKLGPYGGDGGGTYGERDQVFTTIRQMKIVVVGSIVEAICVDYDQSGSLVRTGRHGGPREGKTYTVMLEYPNEFLTSISGHITTNTNVRIIQSLTLHSNRRAYGPYGEEKGIPFSFNDEKLTEGGKIVGFFGNCGLSVDSIGAYYGQIPLPYPFKSIGPFGFKEGKVWDDGKHMDIRQITVGFSSVFEFISVVYDNYGHPTLPFSHGKQQQGEIQPIILDYPYEYLTSISGHLREDHGKLILQSLSLHSNVTKYGPFGYETGIPFSGPATGGKIVGFYGSFDSSIVSISAYLEPVSHLHPVRSVGPFGGHEGLSWDDGQHTDLKKIIIKSGIAIESISCVYVNDHNSVEEFRHDGCGSGDFYTVNLDCPDEYITSVAGYYGKVVTSLMFRSNRRVYGPFGKEGGTYFESPPNIGKIIGLYGKSGSYLDSIGAYVAPVYHVEPIRAIGPYGGQGGNQWDDGKYSDIRKIFISYGTIIDGIICSYGEKGEVVMDVAHGGRGGNSYTMELDYPDEYLISMSGHTGNFGDTVVVRSLAFQSNKQMYGPFGSRGDTSFSFTSSIGKIAGFYGRSGRYLNAIGAHIELLPDRSQPSIGKITGSSERRGFDQRIRTIGPYGGLQGQQWDDGKHSNIRKIFISYGSIIDGICCSYGEINESIVESTHGGRGGNSHTIELDYPDEHLQSMSGYTGNFKDMVVIRCIEFQSNKKKYGPFGSKGDTPFSFKSSIGKIVGFFGRSDRYLNAIGAYFEQFPDKR